MFLLGAVGTKILYEMFKDSQRILGLPVKSAKIRSDSWGDGHYGASRSGGKRKHNGIDLEVAGEGYGVLAPFDGEFDRQADPYVGDSNYDGIQLKGTGKYEGLKVKIFYCKEDPIADVKGESFKRGQRIATTQNISKKYSENMKPHIHVEVYDNGVRVDPMPYFGLA